MRGTRSGFTVIELAMVCVIVGTVSAIALPHFSGFRANSAVRSVKQTTAAMLASARASAVQRGWKTSLVRAGDSLKVVADSSGTKVQLVPWYSAYSVQGVKLSPSPTRDTISFDPRGYGSGLSSLEVIRFSRSTIKDSVCVTKLGKVEWSCSL